jgi:hypothetical protein
MGVLSAEELLGVLSLDPLATGAPEGRRGEEEPKPTGVGRVDCEMRPAPERILLLRLTEEPRGVSSEFRDMFDPVLYRVSIFIKGGGQVIVIAQSIVFRIQALTAFFKWRCEQVGLP